MLKLRRFDQTQLFAGLGSAILATLLATPAFAQEWQSAFGQGAKEATVTLGPGNMVRVSCTGGFVRPITGVSFLLAGEEPPANSIVSVIIDGNDPLEVPINDERHLGSNTHVEADWFETVVEGLKSGTSVYVRYPNATGARFSLKGASDAIGDCPADFWR